MSSDKIRSATAVGFCEESDEAAMRRVNDEVGQMANAAQALGARERLALACRLLTDEGHGRSLAGQVTVRAEEPGTFWTNSFGS